MISSPCANCPRKNLPKDDCLKDCKLLQAVQDIQLSARECSLSTAVDCTEESRYTINLEIPGMSAAL